MYEEVVVGRLRDVYRRVTEFIELLAVDDANLESAAETLRAKLRDEIAKAFPTPEEQQEAYEQIAMTLAMEIATKAKMSRQFNAMLSRLAEQGVPVPIRTA